MALFPEIDFDKAAADAQKAMHAPLGFMSPMWLAYSSLAGAGVAYWWMNQFTKPLNLDAMRDTWGKYSLVPMPELPLGEAPAVVQEMVTQELAAVEKAAKSVAEAMTPVISEPAVLAAALAPDLEGAQVVAETAPKIAEAASDDLTKLSGIGPTLASKLSDLGVKTFNDIASWTEDDVENYDKTLKLLGRATRNDWIGQARQLAEASGATAH